MSASPSAPTSVKRPLEDASSPSRNNDQPDAKRPALESVIKSNGSGEEDKLLISDTNGSSTPSPVDGDADPVPAESKANGDTKTEEPKDDQGDTIVQDTGEAGDAKPGPVPSAAHVTTGGPPSNAGDETAWIHIRSVISSPEAATIIGKQGENVSNIRKMSNAKCTVSDYQKGAVERILTVSGVVDAVAKAFGLIIRTLNNEPLGDASNSQSKTYPLRLLIPHVLIGSIIGKGGSRIREIQDASGARLNASDACLPLSSERSLVVMGVADAVHIATYYVGSTLLEQLNERFGGPAASAYATRSGGPVGVVPGGLQVVPYSPQPAQGNYGHRDNYNNRRQDPRSHYTPQQGGYSGGGSGGSQGGGQGGYSQPQGQQASPNMAMHYQPQAGGGAAGAGYAGGAQMPQQQQVPHHGGGGPQGGHQQSQQPMAGGGMAGQPLTQQIYIPNDMVGAIIGKGGTKINEIRQMSGSVIKINEPQDNSNERLVTITGTEECNRMALYMLYSRLGQYTEGRKEPESGQDRRYGY